MKKCVILTAIALAVLAALPLSAQVRNSVNASLEEWTVDGAESAMKEKISNAIIQQNGNTVQYTLQVRDEENIRYQFDRVTKRLRRERKGEDLLVVPEGATFAESGSTSSLSYTDKDGAVHVLKFKKK